MLKVTLLQTPGVELDGIPVAFPFKRVDALFYYMVVRRSATRQELISLLWESCDESVGLKNLRNALYTLKKCLGGDFLLSPHKALVVVNDQWNLECDYDRFTRQEDFSAYQGPFMQGFFVKQAFSYEEWLLRTRETLHAQYLGRLEEQAKTAANQEQWGDAVSWAAAYLQEEPFDEAMNTFLMTCYRQMRQYSKAAGIYQRLKQQLDQELGANPLSSTTALYYEIMNEWNEITQPPGGVQQPVPIGREKPYAGLQAAYAAFCEGTARRSAQVLVGEVGSGKSELISHFLKSADLSQVLILRGACLMSETQVPLAPFDTLMLTIGEFITREQIVLPAHVAACLRQTFLMSDSRQEEQVPRMMRRADHTLIDSVLLMLSILCRRKRILLILEDIQWLDSASFSLLDALLRRMDAGGMMAVLTSRADCRREIAAFLDEAVTDEIVRRHKLYPLTSEETERFLHRELGEEPARQMYEQFYAQTGGNLYLLTQLTRAYQRSGDVDETVQTMGEILMERLTGLPQEAGQVAELLSLFSEKTAVSTLLKLLDGDDRGLSRGLDVLKGRGLIEETQEEGEACYHFMHQRIRQLVYEQLTFFRRRPLHQKAAEILAAELSLQDAEACRGAALQFEMAGLQFQAAEYRIHALECESVYNCEPFPVSFGAGRGHTKAQTLWQQALKEMSELSALRSSAGEDGHLALLEQRLLLIQGRIALFQGRLEEGAALLGNLSGGDWKRNNAKLMIKACYLLARSSLYTQAAELAERYTNVGMRLLEHSPDPHMAARFHQLRGNCFCLRAEYEKSTYYLIEAIDYLEKQPDREGCRTQLAEVYMDYGKVCRQKRNYAKAANYYKKALAIVEQRTPPVGTVWAYAHYARMAFALEDHAKARELFRRAYKTAGITGELWGTTAAAAFCAYYSILDEWYDKAAEYLAVAQRYSQLLDSPVEKTILAFVSMMAKNHLQLERITHEALKSLLPESVEHYARQGSRLLTNIPDVFEAELLSRSLRDGIAAKNSYRASELYSKNKHFMTE